MKDLPNNSKNSAFFVLQVSSGSNQQAEQLDLSPICHSEDMPQRGYIGDGRIRNPAPAPGSRSGRLCRIAEVSLTFALGNDEQPPERE
ncbi:hypothetical protein [Bradyrhizobium guangzhouense]|uniref:hypothetical protein n=1 Tax=Bradyrhizobium guangzhouense TaxID=1325095 RepID=UPI0010090480|nr:hypothetical protein [Bradyrhizobium guangzhouense]